MRMAQVFLLAKLCCTVGPCCTQSQSPFCIFWDSISLLTCCSLARCFWPDSCVSLAVAAKVHAHKWQAKSGCVFDNAPEGGPFTLLVVNFGACDDSSLYEHLRDKLGETQAASQSLSPPVC